MSADILAALARIEGKIDALSKRPASATVTVPDGGDVAPDSELDSKYGDPTVRKTPPRWTGGDIAGKKYSECAPDALDSLAGFLEWQAKRDAEKGTEDGNKYAGYARKDAARARGWAKRKRSGWKPPADSNAALFGGGASDPGPPPDDDILF